MEKIAEVLLNSTVPLSDSRIAIAAGVDRTTVWKVKQSPEFNEWLLTEFRRQKGFQFVALHQFGMRRAMAGDHQFFRTIYLPLGESLGEIQPQQPATAVNVLMQHIMAVQDELQKPPPPREECEREVIEALDAKRRLEGKVS